MINVPVAFIFILGAFLVPLLRGNVRKAYLLLLPLVGFVDLINMPRGTGFVMDFIGLDLILGRVDNLSMVFGYVFVIMAFIGNLYALHVKESGQHVAAMLYVGGSLGVVFAGDYLSLFIFWELMAISSVWLIWYRGTKISLNAGFRYLLVHVFGGVCLLSGILLLFNSTGSILFEQMDVRHLNVASYLILIGFMLNAAVPPLHAWLTDAYPEATVTGIIFLSAFTTKTAIYVLLRAFPGTEALIWIGAIMAVYGVVFAVLENDIRRLLSYHIISQVGYMVSGVGLGTMMAVNGSASHAFTHILYKGLLMMGAGAVIYTTGKSKLTELGGLHKKMPVTLILYMIGGFSISAFPFFSGFVSKSMVIAAAAGEHMAFVWLMLTLASAGTFLHTGLKLPYFTFFGKDSGINAREPPKNMLLAMGIAAFLSIFIGVYPQSLYNILPYSVDFAPYTAGHIVGTLQILLFTALGFFLLLKQVKGTPTITLDADWLYRKGAGWFVWIVNNPLADVGNMVTRVALNFFTALLWFSRNPVAAMKIIVGMEKRDRYPDIPQHLEVVSSNAVFVLIFLSICIIFLLGGGQ
ncbi:MAG: Na(+)/H(+) antiporter subunit D [Candidatus Desulfatibia sp.]|uniref:Na(+)/H(+) antiporter subunit D n=1 Tax=Candidatus Desulfatibia sp. TaxID=3101189 RepID=UPI002F3020A6